MMVYCLGGDDDLPVISTIWTPDHGMDPKNLAGHPLRVLISVHMQLMR